MRRYLTRLRQVADNLHQPGNAASWTVPLIGLTVPLGWRRRPAIIRHGLDPDDPAPLYSMEPTRLRLWFQGYATTPEFQHQMLYGETVALSGDGMRPITVDGAVDIADLRVEIAAVPYELPVALEPHRDAMLDYFKRAGKLRRIGDTWENNRTARLASFDPATARMVLQEASYFDQIATNLSVDTDSGHLPPGVLSIRRNFEPPRDGRLVSLAESALANTLGVAGVLFARDGQALMRERSQWLGSINQPRVHCSVSGVYELPLGSRRGETHGYDLLRYGIELEIRQELNLEPGEYSLHPIALSRELPRHGKPQLFFAIFCDIPALELVDRLNRAEERHEFLNDPNLMFRVDEARYQTYDRFTYEGWAALRLASQFVKANADRVPFAAD